MVYLDEQVVRQLYEAFNQGNFEVVLKLYADDVALHCPGHSQISGEYHGRNEVLDFWKKHREVSGGTFKPQVITVVENDEHLVVITTVHTERDGRAYAWRRILHFLLYDARVHECWIYDWDQYLADEAFG